MNRYTVTDTTRVTTDWTVVVGSDNIVIANACIVVGDGNHVVGHDNKVFGSNNTVIGDRCRVAGLMNRVTYSTSTAVYGDTNLQFHKPVSQPADPRPSSPSTAAPAPAPEPAPLAEAAVTPAPVPRIAPPPTITGRRRQRSPSPSMGDDDDDNDANDDAGDGRGRVAQPRLDVSDSDSDSGSAHSEQSGRLLGMLVGTATRAPPPLQRQDARAALHVDAPPEPPSMEDAPPAVLRRIHLSIHAGVRSPAALAPSEVRALQRHAGARARHSRRSAGILADRDRLLGATPTSPTRRPDQSTPPTRSGVRPLLYSRRGEPDISLPVPTPIVAIVAKPATDLTTDDFRVLRDFLSQSDGEFPRAVDWALRARHVHDPPDRFPMGWNSMRDSFGLTTRYFVPEAIEAPNYDQAFIRHIERQRALRHVGTPAAATSAPGLERGTNEDNTCGICFSLMAKTVMLPCMHRLCQTCTAELIANEHMSTNGCPFCRRPVRSTFTEEVAGDT